KRRGRPRRPLLLVLEFLAVRALLLLPTSSSWIWHAGRRRTLHRRPGHDADVLPADELPVDQPGAERDVPVQRDQRAVDAGLAAPGPAAPARARDLPATTEDVAEHILRLESQSRRSGTRRSGRTCRSR